MIQPTFNKINSVALSETETRVKAETSFGFLGEIKKAVSIKARAFITSRQVEGTQTKAKAKVVFYLVYLNEEGYAKAESETEVSVEFPYIGNVSVTACDAKINQSTYLAYASVIFSLQNKISEENDCLTGGENLIVKQTEQFFDVYYEAREGRQTVSDEFDLQYTVKEVLSYGTEVYPISVTSGLGRIIFEGEAVLTLKALPFSENNDIVKEYRIIPFRYELELLDAMPENKALGEIEVVSTNLKIFSDEAKNKSTVSVDVTLSFSGETVAKESVNLVVDAYEKEYSCDATFAEFSIPEFLEQRCETQKVSGVGGVAVEGGRIITSLGENLSVYSIKKENGKLSVDGAVRCDVIFKNTDNGITSVSAETPFTFELTTTGTPACVKVVLADLSSMTVGGEIMLEGRLKVVYKSIIDQKIKCINNITEREKRQGAESAISVYIPRDGDFAWDVAKELGVTEEDVVKLNPELSFPLTEKERVIIYRQKI